MRLPVAVSLASLAFLLVPVAGLSGCATGPAAQSGVAAPTGATLKGHVHGGQQPVVGSAIYLYEAGSGGDGTAATSLLKAGTTTTKDANGNYYVTSDGNGGFSISGDYTCPTQPAEVYLVALGGNPGLSIGTNAGLAEMAALGLCSSLTSSTDVWVSEVTTVGSVAALYPYMSGYGSLADGPTDAAAFTAAFTAVNEFTNIATGSAPGPGLPAGYYASSNEINTLGNVLAACVNSAGGVAGDGSPCGNLYLLTKPSGGSAPTDTLGALLNVLKNPTQNAGAIFGLIGSLAPFQPSLSSAPSGWTLPIVPVPGTPVFSLAAGTYSGAQTVAISESDPTAVVYYTTNGATPTSGATVYTGPLSVSTSETVQAVAIESSRIASATASAAYTIASSLPQQAQTPVFSPPAGTYTAAQTVTISSATGGAAVYYTMDGTTPTTGSTLYSGPVAVSTSGTLKAIAVLAGYTNSAVATAAYSIGGYGVISTIAGNGTYGYAGDNGPGISAELYDPSGVTLDASGDLYIADYINSRVRFLSTSGTITTYAGNGTYGYLGDNGPATAAELRYPLNTILDSSGNLYIADTNNYVVRKVTPAGVISTFAGNNTRGYTGDNGPATSASLNHPAAFAFDAAGDLLIVDTNAQVIRKVTPAGTITTVAGNGTFGFSGDGGPATSAQLAEPFGIAVDSAGNMYIGDSENNRVRKVNAAGVISTIAGSGAYGGYGNGGYSGDGGPATSAQLNAPYGLALDSAGNLYVADTLNSVVRRINPSGVISTVAGNGAFAFGGDGGLATSAELNQATSIAVDAAGNLYLADYLNQRVRKVTFQATSPGLGQTAEPVLSLAAGSYTAGQTLAISDDTAGAVIYYTTNGTTPTTASAVYSGPMTISATETFQAIAVAPNRANSAVAAAKYTVASGPPAPTFTPAAGSYGSPVTVTLSATGATGFYYTLNGTTPTTSNYYGYLSANGTTSNGSITVSSSETVKAIAVNSSQVYGLPGSASYTITYVAAAPVFSLASGTYINAQSLTLSTTTPGASIYYTTDGSTPTTASKLYSGAITLSTSETVSAIAVASGYTNSSVATAAYTIIQQAIKPTITPAAGTYTQAQTVTITSASSGAAIYFTTDGSTPTTSSTLYSGPITVATSETVSAVAVLGGALNSAVASAAYVINTTLGEITTVAGNGIGGYGGDGLQATVAYVNNPYGVAVDSSGNMYIADYGNSRVRKVSPAGVITTLAGTGTGGYSGDNGPATSAMLNGPIDVAVDASGNVFIADFFNHRIRKVTAGTGTITTIAGNGTGGYNGEGTATGSELDYPAGVATDTAGNVYIADYFNSRIRKVTTGGVISTVAGGGAGGDGSLATGASLSNANGVAVDAAGNIYIGDGGGRVRKVNTAGIISTIAGNGGSGNTGDGGPATSASLSGTEGIAVDSSGNVYIGGAGIVRKVTPGGIISTYAGNGTQGYSGDGGAATLAQTTGIAGLGIDSSGNLYLADGGNNRVRKITYGPASVQLAAPAFSLAAGTYPYGTVVTLSDSVSGADIYYTTDGSTPTTGSTPYTGAITLTASETVSAIAVASGYKASAVSSVAYTITPPAATPTITPAAGAYITTITVSIADTTPGAVIHYTTDGSTPTASSPVYNTPFVLTQTATTVSAIAIASGYVNSSVASGTYYLDVAPTYFSPLPSIYTSTQFVTIATPTPGATVYYTLDGSTPTTSSAVYMTPIGVSGNTTLKSMAIRSGYLTSSVSTGTYQVSVANAGDRLLEVGAATGSGPDVGADCSMTLTINGTAVPALCTSAATNRYYDTLIRLCNVPANTAVSVSWTIPTSTLTPYDEFEADALGFTVFGGNYIIPVTTGAGGYIIAHDDGFPLYGTNPQTFFPSLVTDTSQQNLVYYQPTCTVIPGLTQ